jgi:hypothetical protein
MESRQSEPMHPKSEVPVRRPFATETEECRPDPDATEAESEDDMLEEPGYGHGV